MEEIGHNDEYSQSFPDYDTVIPTELEECTRGTNKHSNRGKLSREGERRKKAKWRAKNAGKYKAYMRDFMRNKRLKCSHDNGWIMDYCKEPQKAFSSTSQQAPEYMEARQAPQI